MRGTSQAYDRREALLCSTVQGGATRRPGTLRSVDGCLDNGSLQNRPGRHECHRGTESRGGLVPSPRATQRCPFNGQLSAVVGVLRVFGSAFGTPFCGKSLKYSPTPAPLPPPSESLLRHCTPSSVNRCLNFTRDHTRNPQDSASTRTIRALLPWCARSANAGYLGPLPVIIATTKRPPGKNKNHPEASGVNCQPCKTIVEDRWCACI